MKFGAKLKILSILIRLSSVKVPFSSVESKYSLSVRAICLNKSKKSSIYELKHIFFYPLYIQT